jgi:hypothetical protein
MTRAAPPSRSAASGAIRIAVASSCPLSFLPRRPFRVFVNALLDRMIGVAIVDRDDGYRAELRRLFELADECRRRCCRHSITGRLRLDPRTHRQLDSAVRLSVGLLLFAIVMTYWIRPDRPIETVPGVAGLAVAGE